MRHRKNNYGFNNFSFIKKKKISKYLIVICAILVTSLTIGFAASSANLVMKSIAVIRVDKTVRLTGISVNSTSGNSISRNEEYSVSNIFGDVVLPSKDSYVKYDVDITNLGNVKMGALPSVTQTSICTAVTEATTGNVPSGSFNYGDEYTCQVGDSYTNTFFVLENNTDTVSLIMKENYTDSYVPKTLSWCTDGTKDNTTCKNITATGSDAVEGKDYLGHIKSIFNKDEVEVNFPSASQVATASGNTFNNSSISSLPTWLYDYLSGTTHPVSGVTGYWTTTPRADLSYAWFVDTNGSLYSGFVYLNYRGVRPVITISKSAFEDSILDYTIDDYSNGEAIPVCDGDSCTNGVTKKIYVTIKYKDGISDSLVTSEPQSFNIGFDYKQIFKVTYDGVICTDCKLDAIEGNTYTSVIDLTNPRVTMGSTLLIKDTNYTYDETTKLLTIPNVNGDITIKEEVKEDTGKISNGQIVYFNVDTGKVCTDYTESQSETKVKSGCMKFYVFNDDGGNKVNLILDHDTTPLIDWNDSDDVTNGPGLLLEQLKTDTSSWKGTLTPTNYSHPNYTIDYTGYKARLITAEEVATITGNTSFDISTDEEGFFYFDTNTSEQSDTCRYDSETETDITSGCNYQWLSGTSDEGYWTSTQFVFDTSSILAYLIYEDSSMIATDIYNGSVGIRPVIEVPRSVVTPQEYVCKSVTTATTGNVPTGNFNYGDEYTCQVGDNYSNTFFVLENNTDTVSLIMKENFTDSYIPATLAWCTDDSNDVETCKNITSTGSEAPDGADYLGHIKSIFNKSGITVSFPRANQIATTVGLEFEDNSFGGLPIWLYDYLFETTHPVSDVFGYWTITRYAEEYSAWNVLNTSVLAANGADDTETSGVRPVITISKDLIN